MSNVKNISKIPLLYNFIYVYYKFLQYFVKKHVGNILTGKSPRHHPGHRDKNRVQKIYLPSDISRLLSMLIVKMVATGLTFCCGGFLKKANNLRFYNWEHRLYSQQNVLKKATSYTSTILLPKTEYPARHKAAKRVQVDSDIHKVRFL